MGRHLTSKQEVTRTEVHTLPFQACDLRTAGCSLAAGASVPASLALHNTCLEEFSMLLSPMLLGGIRIQLLILAWIT